MKWLTTVIGISLISTISGQNGVNLQTTNHNTSCTCVEYYRCRTGKDPNQPTFDIRGASDQCRNLYHVCCEPKDLIPDPIGLNSNARDVKCGKNNPGGVGFLLEVGQNHETHFGEFPWMVAILQEQQYQSTDKIIFVYQCGGSLIHPQVVLTAAHCVFNKTVNKLRIRAGEWDTQSTNEIYPHQDRLVSRIIVHEQFYYQALHNDIALIILKEPFELDEHVDTVCLPDVNVFLNTENCYATGWGKNRFGSQGHYVLILKKVQLPLVKRKDCLNALRRTRLGSRFQLHDSFICAGGLSGMDTCEGDGGSPLFCQRRDQPEHFHQVGIVAWGIGCGDPNLPAAYVNVLIFRSWIDEQMALSGLNSSTYVY